MADTKENPEIRFGRRLAVFGRAGAGKTYLAKWFMLRSIMQTRRAGWVVLDTKYEPEFDEYRPVAGLVRMRDLGRRWADTSIIVTRPLPRENKPEFLDQWLGDLHDSYENIGVLIDEGYQVSLGSRAGEGLTGLITRGRVRRQAVIVGSQRPAWLPQFIYSEANAFAIMSLNLPQDRKKAYEVTGREALWTPLPERSWFYYDVAKDRLTRYGPVEIRPPQGEVSTKQGVA